MARAVFVIKGDKELTRMLNALGKKARPVVAKALRAGSKLVLANAKNTSPVRSGAFRRSLTVRAMKRSRVRVGFRVTQKEINKSGTDRKKAFYGGFVEFGYLATGRPFGEKSRLQQYKDYSPFGAFAEKEERTRQEKVKTYRKAEFTIRQLRRARKIRGQWVMRNAGEQAEGEAIDLYVSEVRRLVEQESG